MIVLATLIMSLCMAMVTADDCFCHIPRDYVIGKIGYWVNIPGRDPYYQENKKNFIYDLKGDRSIVYNDKYVEFRDGKSGKKFTLSTEYQAVCMEHSLPVKEAVNYFPNGCMVNNNAQDIYNGSTSIVEGVTVCSSPLYYEKVNEALLIDLYFVNEVSLVQFKKRFLAFESCKDAVNYLN